MLEFEYTKKHHKLKEIKKMKENNIKLAQKGIDDALETIDALEKAIKEKPLTKDVIKESFYVLSKKVDEIEDILKTEGIL